MHQEVTPGLIKGFRHTGIVVSNLERSLEFYGALLGFSVAKRMEESGAHLDAVLGLKDARLTTVKMSSPDGALIELLHYQSHPRDRGSEHESCRVGISHIALTVKDLDQTYQRLKDWGIEFNAPPQRSPDGGVKLTFCRDPDGMLLELVEVLRE